MRPSKIKGEGWHKAIERKPVKMLVFSLIAVAIGGIIEIIPTAIVDSNIPTIEAVKPYTPLELEGRDIYIREGCNNCHSQMIRPLRFDTKRYGEYSKAGEFVYDHPFLWGSKRTGPDLAREGGKKSNYWHFSHMIMPKETSPGSFMPAYAWLRDDKLDTDLIGKKIRAMQTLGVPYAEGYDEQALDDLHAQAFEIAKDIYTSNPDNKEFTDADVKELSEKELVALIAYLQRLGTDINAE